MSSTIPIEPYAEVMQVDLSSRQDPGVSQPAGRRALLVFWSQDRPVGQLWVLPEDEPGAAVQRFLEHLPVEPPVPPAPPPRTVSVVICTRDRPDELARCLAGLPLQSRPPDEVVVVDNASRGPQTREVALAAGARYVREDRPGLDVARNSGLLAARSEVVAYTDDDTELHPAWLERLAAAFDREDVLAVTGLVLPARLDTEAQWVFERQWGFGRGYARMDFGREFYRSTRARGCPTWEVGAGANMAFRRMVADEVGPFDERLDVGAAGCSGDSEYWYRLLAAGWTCRYEPAAVVFHHHRLRMDDLAAQIRSYMRGHVAALLVQHERTGDVGNLRRAFVTLPAHYARRAVRAARRRHRADPLLGREVSGAVAGVLYYLRTRRRAPVDAAAD